MGYWAYYLLWLLAFYVFGHPILLLGLLAFVLLRRYIPDPLVWARTSSTQRRLRDQVAANPSNATARRDLARIYLERKRPSAALELLAQARARFPDDAELLYLTGVGRLRSGDPEGALGPLVEAIDRDPRTGFGDPYRCAGDALAALGRLEEAEDAYERFVATNGSSLEGWYKLYRVRRRRGEHAAAKRALEEVFDTWRALPGYLRRQQWAWWLRAMPARWLL
ncbi:MAG: tetratricopeptide repeat protein [Myxococcales bacterium]|nr:tetratricopeptide repeat protein [Myxococcales bacterium]